MNLNTPPPGAARAPEIMPAVLRSPKPSRPLATATRHGDALEAMLHGSHHWENNPAPVTWTVTLLSWLLLALDFTAIYANHALAGQDHIFARIITWNDNPRAATLLAILAAVALIVTEAMTRGLRRANVTWLRIWTGAAIASVIAIAAMIVALIVGLVMLVIGTIIAAAAVLLIGFGLAEGLAG